MRIKHYLSVLLAVTVIVNAGFAGITTIHASDYVQASTPSGQTISNTFPDQNLAQAIADQIADGNQEAIIDDLKIGQTTALDLNARDIENLEGIDVFRNLEVLQLSGNNIKSMMPLAQLFNLEELDLSYNKISTIEGLVSVTLLRILNLEGNDIQSIQGLSNNTMLVHLNLADNDIQKIEGLENLINLGHLNLEGNTIETLEGLDNNIALQILYIGNNKISVIENIAHLQDLRNLSLFGNSITEVTGIENLAHLITLDLDHNQITDLSKIYAVIDTLPYLSIVWIRQQIINASPMLYDDEIVVDNPFFGTIAPVTLLNVSNDGIYNSAEQTITWSNLGNDDYTLSVTAGYDALINNSQTIVYYYGTLRVDVMRDEASLYVMNSIVYTGETFNPEINFISATDSYGNAVGFDQVTITGDHVDTTKAGSYNLTFSYGGISRNVTIYVRDNLEHIQAIDSVIEVGSTWNPMDNFVSATDKTGLTIPFAQTMVSGSVDTASAGTYLVVYQNGSAAASITVTVVDSEPDIDTPIIPDPQDPLDPEDPNTDTADSNETDTANPDHDELLPDTGLAQYSMYGGTGAACLGIMLILLSKKRIGN